VRDEVAEGDGELPAYIRYFLAAVDGEQVSWHIQTARPGDLVSR
jgi:hypothetical protein